MLHKTRGIVFKYFKYSETSIIVKIFTEELGLQTYIVNGVRNKSSKNKIALFQPLTLLDLVVYFKETAEINRISEVKCTQPFDSISTDIRKTAIAIFLSEMMYKCIREESEVREMFQFIHNSVVMFDHLVNNFENFHLQFLLKLSRYLGFGTESSDFFSKSMEDVDVQFINDLVNRSYDKVPKINNQTRRLVLDHIISFYKENIDTLKEINSVKILQEVMDS